MSRSGFVVFSNLGKPTEQLDVDCSNEPDRGCQENQSRKNCVAQRDASAIYHDCVVNGEAQETKHTMCVAVRG